MYHKNVDINLSTRTNNRIKFLLFGFLYTFYIGGISAQDNPQHHKSKPNFIIIIADDLDVQQLSCYGGKNLDTKHIDRLASEGLKFNSMIASEAMCIPTRASLLTGL